MRECVKGREGCEVVIPNKPTKGIARALQKTQEEYDSDTRTATRTSPRTFCSHLRAHRPCTPSVPPRRYESDYTRLLDYARNRHQNPSTSLSEHLPERALA